MRSSCSISPSVSLLYYMQIKLKFFIKELNQFFCNIFTVVSNNIFLLQVESTWPFSLLPSLLFLLLFWPIKLSLFQLMSFYFFFSPPDSLTHPTTSIWEINWSTGIEVMFSRLWEYSLRCIVFFQITHEDCHALSRQAAKHQHRCHSECVKSVGHHT